METRVGAALVLVDLTARSRVAAATVAAEAQREAVTVAVLHTLGAVFTRVAGLAGQELTVRTWKQGEVQSKSVLRVCKEHVKSMLIVCK